MGQCDDFKVVWVFSINEEKRKVAKRYAANGAANADAAVYFTDRGMTRDQIDCGLNLGPQAISQSDAFILVPPDVVTKLFFGFGVWSYT